MKKMLPPSIWHEFWDDDGNNIVVAEPVDAVDEFKSGHSQFTIRRRQHDELDADSELLPAICRGLEIRQA